MVVLACSICTKHGKPLLSRQFIAMSQSRIEGLIQSFIKLKTNDQHTSIETDAVRFVYQPLDDLFVILITNKQSNILLDISTLQLVTRVISEYCRSSNESEIVKKRFELILVLDEVVSLGYRENVNLGQIKTISTMESNDERIAAEMQKQKEREAKEESKRKAKMMDLKRKEQRQFGSISSAAPQNYAPQSFNHTPINEVKEYTSQFKPVSQPVGIGMKLGTKTNSLLDNIKAEEQITDTYTPPAKSPVIADFDFDENPDMHEVLVKTEEKVKVKIKDGVLEQMIIEGTMMVTVNTQNPVEIYLSPPTANVAVKANPTLDKDKFSKNIIAPRAGKSFPLSTEVAVLRYRTESKDESQLPILVNAWLGAENTLEYTGHGYELSEVMITVPTRGHVNATSEDGTISQNNGIIQWIIGDISGNENGMMELVGEIGGPIVVEFVSKQLFAGIKVNKVAAPNGSNVQWDYEMKMVADGYEIQ